MDKKKDRKLSSRILRWVAWTGLALIILIISFSVFLTTSPGESLLKSIAETQLAKALGQSVTIEKLETNLLSRLQIKNLEISNNRDGTVIPFIEMNEMKVNYSPWQLVFLNIDISSAQIDSLNVWVLKDSSGFYNFPATAPAEEEIDNTPEQPTAISVALDYLVLNHGVMHFDDQILPLSATLHQLSFLLEKLESNGYSFDVRSYSSKFKYENKVIPVDTIEVDGEWRDQKLQISSMGIKLPGYNLTGNPSIDLGQPKSALEGKLQLKGTPEALATIFKEVIPPKIYPVRGKLDFSVELGGSLDEPVISAVAVFSHIQVAESRLTDGKMYLLWSKNSIELKQFNLGLMGGGISGGGLVDLATPINHNIEFNINNIDLEQVWSALYTETSPYQGKINGLVNSNGPVENIDSMQFQANLTMYQMMFKDKPLPDFNVNATVNRGTANLDIHQAESEIKAQIGFSEQRLEGRFSIKIFKLEPLAGLFNLLGLNGTLRVQGSLSGTTDYPGIDADFNGSKIRYQNLPLDTLAGSFSYHDEQFHFDKTIFGGELIKVDSLNPPFDLDKLRGGFSYQGQFEGSLENPVGEFQLIYNDLSYQDFRAKTLSAELSIIDNIVKLHNFQLNIDSLIVKAVGEYSLLKSQGTLRSELYKSHTEEGMHELQPQLEASIDLSDSSRIRGNVQGRSVDIEMLSRLMPQRNDLGGYLDFELDFTGTMDKALANLKFNIKDPRFQQVQMDSVIGNMTVRSDFLYLRKLELVTQGNRSWAEGKIQLRKPGDSDSGFTENNYFDLSAEGDEIDLRILNPFLTPGMQIAGRCSYRLDINGDMNNPHITGELDIRRGEFTFAEGSLPITGIEADINVQDTLVTFERFVSRIKNTPFGLRGKIVAMHQGFKSDLYLSTSGREMIRSVGTITENDIDFNLKIDQFDLSYLQPFLSDVKNVTGVVNSDIKVQGSFSEPELKGVLNINTMTFQPNMLNTALNNGMMTINFEGNHIEIDSLYLSLNGGSITGSGDFIIENSEVLPLDVRIGAKNVKLDKPGEYLLTVNSTRINYKKQNNQYLLDGDIILGETRLLYNFKPQAILPFTKQVEQPAQTPSAMMKNTRINVRIRDSEKIWVDNNLARIRLHSEVGFIGSLAQPNIGGRVSVEEGYLLYLDRKFQVEKGTIDFVDPNRLNPIVDLEANASVTTYERLEATPYEITLKITGELDQAKVELVSTPPLERSDIVALLTVGATRKQLTGKSSGGGDVSTTQILEQRIQTLSSKVISGYAGKTVERLFGLEDVSVQGNIFNVQKGGPQLVASKRISDSAKLTYTTRVGHLNEQGIRLDYRLSKHFSFEGQTDQEGESSLSIKYNMKFK